MSQFEINRPDGKGKGMRRAQPGGARGVRVAELGVPFLLIRPGPGRCSRATNQGFLAAPEGRAPTSPVND